GCEQGVLFIEGLLDQGGLRRRVVLQGRGEPRIDAGDLIPGRLFDRGVLVREGRRDRRGLGREVVRDALLLGLEGGNLILNALRRGGIERLEGGELLFEHLAIRDGGSGERLRGQELLDRGGAEELKLRGGFREDGLGQPEHRLREGLQVGEARGRWVGRVGLERRREGGLGRREFIGRIAGA